MYKIALVRVFACRFEWGGTVYSWICPRQLSSATQMHPTYSSPVALNLPPTLSPDALHRRHPRRSSRPMTSLKVVRALRAVLPYQPRPPLRPILPASFSFPLPSSPNPPLRSSPSAHFKSSCFTCFLLHHLLHTDIRTPHNHRSLEWKRQV